MQLDRPPRSAPLLLLWAALLLPLPCGADEVPQNQSGEVVFRGNYWRDRNTRVINPTVEVQREIPGGIRVGAHYVLDAITSASVAAGATSDQPFTELRHEAGFRIEVPLLWSRPRLLRAEASYSYSTESDYWSHNLGVRLKSNLFQDNTLLTLGFDYGDNSIGKRLGPTGYLHNPTWVLSTYHIVAMATQLLGPRALLTASYELAYSDGFMANVYRSVRVNGTPEEMENLPRRKLQHTAALTGHFMARTGRGITPYVVLRPGLRLHTSDWSMLGVSPELAVHVPVGPFELRGLFSYYAQSQASFYRADYSTGTTDPCFNRTTLNPRYLPPCYDMAVTWNPSTTALDHQVYTSDVKLGAYSTYTAELGIKWRLGFLRRLPAVGGWLSRSVAELSGGMWFAEKAVGWQFGIPLQTDPAAPAGCSTICAAYTMNLGLYVPL